jgi:hypothetical protein
MREHKTWTNWPESKFDEEVAGFISQGWTLDSRHFGLNNDGGLLCAFLSREVPDSPPPPDFYSPSEVAINHNYRLAMLEIGNIKTLLDRLSANFSTDTRGDADTALIALEKVQSHLNILAGVKPGEEIHADPLEADRELVWTSISSCINGKINFRPIKEGDMSLFNAIKRLCIVEVQP